MDNALGLNGIDFSPEINMVRYLQRIRQYPILSQEDEYEMAVKYQKTKDPNIAQILVTSHLRLVVKVVSKYKGLRFADSRDDFGRKHRPVVCHSEI